MPSDSYGGRGRSAIYNWRVKAGNKEVYSNASQSKCEQFIREHNGKAEDKTGAVVKLRLIPPNK